MTERQIPVFATTDGRQVTVRAIDVKYGLNLVRQGVQKRMGGIPARPTYTITTATGDTEIHPHDETTLETEADKAAWQAYQDATAALETEMTLATMRYILLQGVPCDEPPADWLAQCAFLGIELPENAYERKLTYIQMVMLPTPADLEMAMAAIMGVSSAGNTEGVSAAEDMFRRSLARAAIAFNPTAAG